MFIISASPVPKLARILSESHLQPTFTIEMAGMPEGVNLFFTSKSFKFQIRERNNRYATKSNISQGHPVCGLAFQL